MVKMKLVKVSDMIKTYYPEYYKWETYPSNMCAIIHKTTEEWGILHNMATSNIVIDDVTFKCSETLFQIMKFTDKEVVQDVYRRNNKKWAMHWEKEYRREDWPQMIIDALKFCLQMKYEQCAEFRKEIERSKGLFIVEDETGRKSTSYGVKLNKEGLYEGSNLLGRLLMELRDNGKLEYHLPDDALTFLQYLK